MIPDYIETVGTGICYPYPECNLIEDEDEMKFMIENWILFFKAKRIVIPKSVKVLKSAPFWNIPYLEEIIIDENSPAAKLVDGVLFSKDGKNLFAVLRQEKVSTPFRTALKSSAKTVLPTQS